MASELRIPLKTIWDGVQQLTLSPPAEELDVDVDLFDEIQVELTLDRQDERVLAHYAVSATAHLECDRTLVAFDQDVEGSGTVLFAPSSILGDADEDDSAVVLEANAEILDLTQPVRDTLMLALPVRRIAPGAEDLEIQTQFGLPSNPDDAIDPRWEALKKLKINDNETP